MDTLLIAISAVVVGSSVLAWLACQGRQPVILGYFVCGLLLGPFSKPFFSVVGVPDVTHAVGAMDEISRLGVMLLLFLAGLVLHVDRLQTFFRTAVVVTLTKCALCWAVMFAFLIAWRFEARDSLIAAVALTFSSTILVVKLLPTTTLHQKRMGSICIAVLIAEDLLAVVALLFMGAAPQSGLWELLLGLPLRLVLLVAIAGAGEQFVLRRMMRRADTYAEVLMMLCLGWCVGIALLAQCMGLPYEIGAFVAGVSIARGKIALVFSEQLKPLRDFFLMFFFFVLGAGFELSALRSIWIPAVLATVVIAGMRPFLLAWLFQRRGEERAFALETGFRMGQASEFALIIAVVATQRHYLSPEVAQFVKLATVLSMLVSSYLVVLRYPTPIGVQPGLQRD
ncbi:MAG: cation:proton antiporter [Kiritimatiellia bacterium]